jgi:hypothetical protein
MHACSHVKPLSPHQPPQSQLWHLRLGSAPRTCQIVIVQTTHPLSTNHAPSPSNIHAMISSGFTNAPVTRFLVFGTVIGALLATLTDSRYLLHIQVVPHFWGYGQFWRCLTWQVCLSMGKRENRKRSGREEEGMGEEERVRANRDNRYVLQTAQKCSSGY